MYVAHVRARRGPPNHPRIRWAPLPTQTLCQSRIGRAWSRWELETEEEVRVDVVCVYVCVCVCVCVCASACVCISFAREIGEHGDRATRQVGQVVTPENEEGNT